MKDQAVEIAKREATDQARRNRLREYLHHVLLRQLFERDLLDELVFHGGTALRIVHDLPRFSEDLDFHLVRPDPAYDLDVALDGMRRDLESSGYRVRLKPRLQGAVQSCMVVFERLLYECGLSSRENQKLNVRLEVDTNPPPSFRFEKKLVNVYLPYVVLHHDKPSFLAGKLHAVLQRRFAKGRDFFDLFFYLSRWPEVSPNLPYLNHALRQTGYPGPRVTETNWRELAASRVKALSWNQVERDVEPFLLRPEDRKALDKSLLLKMLESADR
ncbi:MAG TPA: nucleotidyl transferase AbiEii/AbiGii toxin family protein [Vicinamibacteria bacterium]|nr:nucleotidyl transferase AbiEii/AbiGii toxin family protein [Vicinamibacteria bacterium]